MNTMPGRLCELLGARLSKLVGNDSFSHLPSNQCCNMYWNIYLLHFLPCHENGKVSVCARGQSR